MAFVCRINDENFFSKKNNNTGIPSESSKLDLVQSKGYKQTAQVNFQSSRYLISFSVLNFTHAFTFASETTKLWIFTQFKFDLNIVCTNASLKSHITKSSR